MTYWRLAFKMRWAGHVACMGAMKTIHGKPVGKRPLGRPGHRWEYNTIMDLKEIGCEGINWIHLVQDRDQ
jgi:hypothetical protein